MISNYISRVFGDKLLYHRFVYLYTICAVERRQWRLHGPGGPRGWAMAYKEFWLCGR